MNHSYCENYRISRALNRRELLRAGSLGLLGLSLPELLQAQRASSAGRGKHPPVNLIDATVA